MTEPQALETRELGVTLGGRRILENVSLSVGPGEFLCLLGPNGGGKTTFLKAVLGLVPSRGTVDLFGTGATAGRRRVGYLPQRKGFAEDFPAAVCELVVAAQRGRWPWRVRPAEREHAAAVLGRVRGEALIDRPLSSLSGGETQRAFLARALVNDPPLILIDEPLAALDTRGREDLLAILAELAARDRTAAVIVTHEPETVTRIADRVAYLDVKLRAAGPPDAVLEDPDLQAAAFAGADHTHLGR
jgi:ABC-type Mn2+/Zn2+ transport system ATPase subunit